jgi:hypothetical protein
LFPDGAAPAKLRVVSKQQRDGSWSAVGLTWRARAVGGSGLLVLLATAGCGGSLSYRSVENVADKLPIGQGVARVRLEIEDGTVGVDSGTDRVFDYRGGVRRAADTAQDLERLEQIPIQLTAAPDPADPTVLVVRGPVRDAASPAGVFAYELGIRLPPELEVEIRVRNNGDVTVANRQAKTRVETGRGDLRFPACSGGLWAETGRGNVIAFDHRGDLDLRTKVGDMQAFVVQADEKIRLVTGQGTIQCHVPPDLDFEVDARAEIGRAGAKGFGLTSEKVGEYGAVLTGVHGSGRTKIVLRTGSGHLSLAPHR